MGRYAPAMSSDIGLIERLENHPFQRTEMLFDLADLKSQMPSIQGSPRGQRSSRCLVGSQFARQVLVYPALQKINVAIAHLFIRLSSADYSPKMTPEATI